MFPEELRIEMKLMCICFNLKHSQKYFYAHIAICEKLNALLFNFPLKKTAKKN